MKGTNKSQQVPEDRKKLVVLLNNDADSFIFSRFGKPDPEIVVQQYRTLLGIFLAAKPGIFAQRVGSPDPVLYRSEVATIYGKNVVEATKKTWENIYSKRDKATQEGARKGAADRSDAIDNLFRVLETGTDPLAITVEECHKHGIPIVPSYRMNSEDFYDSTYLMSDLGRRHPEWRIPISEEELKFHREEGLQHSPDLVMFPEGLSGALDPDGKMPGDLRATFFMHRKQMAEAVRRMISWQPQRIIIAHGRWYRENAVAELKRAFRWLPGISR